MRPAGFKHTEETKEKLRLINIGKYKGYKHSDESRKHMSEAHKGQISWSKGKTGIFHQTDEAKKKISKSLTGTKQTEDHIKNALRRRLRSSLESKFEGICTRYKLPYRFTGNGDVVVGGKNPDFVSTNNNKIAIEVYYTKHKLMFRTHDIENWKKERSEIFRKYGWKIIFFNESEVNDHNVLEKLCQL